MNEVLEPTAPAAPPSPTYVAPRLTHRGPWHIVTLLTSIPMGPGNFSLPGMNETDPGGR